MKKIKLLTPILGLTTVACGIAPLASCGCSQEQTDGTAVPTEGFEIKDVTLKGFKDTYDYKNYTKLVIPSNVKVIDQNAFKGILAKNCKITTVVIPGTVETIRKDAFTDCNNVSIFDFSSFTIDQIYALTVESGAFGNLTENGIYSYVKMNDSWTAVQKEALKNKLLGAGIPYYWLTEQSTGNVEVTNSMEQTAVGGTGLHELDIKGQYDYTYKYTAVLSKVDGTDGVTVEAKDVEVDPSFKSIKINTKMTTYDEHVLADGDWVSYKIALFCSYEDESSNETVIKWVQNIETFKLTYQVAHVSSVSITQETKEALAGLSVGSDDVKLECQINPETAAVQDVEWTSSNPDVIDIYENEDGIYAEAIAVGTSTITVTTKDGSKTDSVVAEVEPYYYNVPFDASYRAFIDANVNLPKGQELSYAIEITKDNLNNILLPKEAYLWQNNISQQLLYKKFKINTESISVKINNTLYTGWTLSEDGTTISFNDLSSLVKVGDFVKISFKTDEALDRAFFYVDLQKNQITQIQFENYLALARKSYEVMKESGYMYDPNQMHLNDLVEQKEFPTFFNDLFLLVNDGQVTKDISSTIENINVIIQGNETFYNNGTEFGMVSADGNSEFWMNNYGCITHAKGQYIRDFMISMGFENEFTITYDALPCKVYIAGPFEEQALQALIEAFKEKYEVFYNNYQKTLESPYNTLTATGKMFIWSVFGGGKQNYDFTKGNLKYEGGILCKGTVAYDTVEDYSSIGFNKSGTLGGITPNEHEDYFKSLEIPQSNPLHVYISDDRITCAICYGDNSEYHTLTYNTNGYITRQMYINANGYGAESYILDLAYSKK